MASRTFKWTAAGSAVALIGLGLVGYSLIAAQGKGVLSQSPLNDEVSATPSFIMAVDDSGSMTFQTQFPGMDGEGCWNTSRLSFFDATGALNTTGNCDYFYVLPGVRINGNYYGVPPIDSLGFARSSAYNPTYFDPTVKYEPWMEDKGKPMPYSNPLEAKLDPKPTGGAGTINLTSDYYSTATADLFRIQRGMVIQANTRYDGNLSNSAQTWNRDAANIAIQYRPATFFTKWTSDTEAYPQQQGAANVYSGATRTKVFNACGPGCTMWKYTLPASKDDPGSINFATWFTYYGNRNRAMIAGMTRSLADVTNLKVGYFRINQHASYDSGTNASKRVAMRDMGTETQKTSLFKDMLALTANGGTPNRQAVNAAALQFTRTDDGAPISQICQKNAVMLFTDGFSNGGGPTVGNTDQGMGAPFSDGNSDTMADIVTRFYVNNGTQPPLRPDLTAGKVPVPAACKAGTDKKLDCQTNLHLNFYGVTLGARGNLFNPDLDQDPYEDAAVYGNWPPRQDDQRSTVDDIWHATTNTRGEYINARTPAEITDAMRRVLSAVTTGGSPSGGTGASGARIGAGSISVAPEYKIENDGTDWYSRLTAYKLSVDPTTRALVQTPYWEASDRLQAAASRRIFFTKGGTTREFTAGNVALADLCSNALASCGATDLTTLGVSVANAVSYLRGDTSGEKRNSGTLRDRTTRLGDIITSTPAISSPVDDFGYRRLGGALATSYGAYLTNKATNGRYMIYVGANDGMLHAFNGGMDATGADVAGGGSEAFAYIPGTALGHMGNLLFPLDPVKKSDQIFKHRYFVDGQVAVADSYYGNAWHTTLVGAAGAGGRSVFGLDVTVGTTFGAGSKLWEISDLDTSLPAAVRANIGHVLAKPVIVPVLDAAGTPSFKAIFGNGFNSASGKAVLFVVDIATGAATMIEAVETGTGVPAGSNGLGSIVVVDRWGGTGQASRTRDGYSDTVYGTDQKGAVWKFDLRSPANLSVPLFTTRPDTDLGVAIRQPITGGITAGTGSNGGVMLYFGTGSFSFMNDRTDNTMQSLYGVNDATNGPVTATLTRSNLVGRSIVTVDSKRTVPVTSTPANARGWYIDLPLKLTLNAGSERFVGNPSLANGIVSLSTYVPGEPTNSCAGAGVNWFFALSPLTGEGALGRATLNSPTGTGFDQGTAGLKNNSPGSAPVLNNTPFALPRQQPPALGAGGGGNPPTPPTVGCVQGYPNGPDIVYVPYPCGRQSWRQIQ